MVLLNTPPGGLELPDIEATLEDEVFNYSMFDLNLVLEEQRGGIVGGVTFASDLFERSTVERWMGCFKVLLAHIADGASFRIGELPILPESERRRVLETFNATHATIRHEGLVHELFEEQVQKTPHAVAVMFEGQALTYAELNAKANQLARYLVNQGIGPDQLVAICVERSLDLVVSLLAVLKSGGAYVPLDPSYPTERLQHMLANARPRVLLTQADLQSRLALQASQIDASPVALAGDRAMGKGQPGGSLLNDVTACLCDLHLWIDRGAEGRDGHACGAS